MNISIDKIISSILFNNSNIDVFIVTLIAGIFGFIIAAIPFTIQVLEIKNNDNIKLVNKNKTMKEKLFQKYFDVLKNAFWLFLFLLFLRLLFILNLKSIFWLNLVLICGFIYLNYLFFRNLYRLIIILQELVKLYLNSKE